MKHIPMRSCVGCRQPRDKKELIRVIRTPDGDFETDITGRKNGRGAYICRNMECLKLARSKKALERSFSQAVPAGIYDMLAEELAILADEQET